uniref:WGS project CBME000000000 data, contig CS3487_c000763 n=1 Tax=Fusarium pseudograminearum CS3487 TaxID=1318458 RepID=A0A096PDH8_FUSPS|nr:unnamed protein product [Fusarium pseudograminearum CS3487]
MDSNASNSLQSLSVAGTSRVQVGNNYNTTHNYNKESDQDDTRKLLEALRSTDPRHDKRNIEQTNNHLLREAYVWILENPEFLSWRDQKNESQLLWIRGDPGKGKTMLLCGIIDELRPSTRLENAQSHISLSYFFCQATNSNLNNSTAVIRGLIYLLVVQQPCLLSHLRANIHWDSRVAIEELFRKIVADPILEEAYLIVDALDECSEDLEFLLEMLSTPAPRIKWIVSSRNRVEIEEALEQSSSRLALSLELNEKSVSQAVGYFIDHRTRDLARKKKLKAEVAQKVYRHLIKHANGTFLWVGLVCQRLTRCREWDIIGQLRQLPKGLNDLYARMIDQIRSCDSCDRYIRLLALVSTVFRPLTFSELMAMETLDVDEQSLPDFVRECGSFLTIRDTTILFVHQSAKDFLLENSSELLFQSGLAQHHYSLFQRSLDLLVVLQKDMYDLVHPGVSLDEAMRNRPEPDPLDGLAYALIFWADHIRESCHLFLQNGDQVDIAFVNLVHQFFSKKLLFWLEALSLCHSPNAAGEVLLVLRDLPAVRSHSSVLDTIKDTLRFLLMFGPVINDYPLQIYASGLLFSPGRSLISSQFDQYTPEFIESRSRLDDSWSPILRVFETSPEVDICAMMFSPMNDILVMTTYDSRLMMWKVSDGSLYKKSKYSYATLLTPSPDLQWLAIITAHCPTNAKGNVQDALEARDLNSGTALWTIKLDGRKAMVMGITPDSQWLAVCYEDVLHIYAREGGMRRSWTLEPENFSNRSAWRVSFSSDCNLLLLFLHGCDCHIVVFDLRMDMRYEFPNVSVPGMWWTDDPKFVPNTHKVMICCPREGIFLWDVLKGELEEWFLSEDYSYPHACSHNASWVAIASQKELSLLNSVQRIVQQNMELSAAVPIRGIVVSYDDRQIVVHAKTRAWLLDVHTLLDDKSHIGGEKPTSCILGNGETIAYSTFGRVTIQNPIEESTSEPVILYNLHHMPSLMALSPDGQLIGYYDSSAIYILDLEGTSFRYTIHPFAKVQHIAISSKGIGTSEWIWVVVCTEFKVRVWYAGTGQFQSPINSPDTLERTPFEPCVPGSFLGVLWRSARENESKEGGCEIFVSYDIETGQPLTQLVLPYYHHTKSLSMSPNGKWLLFCISNTGQLLLSDLEAGIHCAIIDTPIVRFSFIDNSALWTDSGVLNFDHIMDKLTVKSKTGRSKIVEMDKRIPLELPLIAEGFDKYGFSSTFDWITLDSKPFIWMPQHYRPQHDGVLYETAIGNHHVNLGSLNGVYSMVFKSNTGGYLRQSAQKLFIQDLETRSIRTV